MAAKQSLVDLKRMQAQQPTSENNKLARSPAVTDAEFTDKTINTSDILDSIVLNESLVDNQRSRTTTRVKQKPQPKPREKAKPWLFQQNASAYTIQLMSSKDQAVIQRFLKGIPPAIKTHSYQYTIKGIKWTAVATGIYPSSKEAGLAVKTLPASLRKNKPWVRNIGAIQKLASR
jgi:septal ring-binding cell division protein DamX